MKRDLEEALAFLFPAREAEVRALLAPLVSDRVRWAVLAVSRGDESELLRCVIDAERDWRDVLQAESMSDEPRGSLIRALPRPEELAFRLHARELTRLGFFEVQDGPFADTKEQLGGFTILECPSLDVALEWAARCPAAASGAMEVRPLGPDVRCRVTD